MKNIHKTMDEVGSQVATMMADATAEIQSGIAALRALEDEKTMKHWGKRKMEK